MSEVELLQTALADLQRRVRQVEAQASRLQRIETAGGGPIHDGNVSNPPTDAQLDAAFGEPGDISQGMLKWVDDNGAETAVYLVVPIGASWWIFTGTKAT